MENVDLEDALMRDSPERVIKDLGAVRIENLVGTEAPTNRFGLYPEDYDRVAGHFLCPYDEQNLLNIQNQGGELYAKKENRNSRRSD